MPVLNAENLWCKYFFGEVFFHSTSPRNSHTHQTQGSVLRIWKIHLQKTTAACFMMKNFNETHQDIKRTKGGLHTNLTVPYISWLLLLDEYKWIWNHTKSWERQREEWVMETLPCGGRISLAAWAPPSPQALPAAGCAARRDSVHRCAALNWAAYKGPRGSTWKLGMFWCYSSPCHMKHPQSFQQRLTRHKKCIWKNQILVLLLLWCVKVYSSQKELYLCNSGTPNMISGIQRAMRKGDCVDAMYEWFLSLLLMKSQGRGF